MVDASRQLALASPSECSAGSSYRRAIEGQPLPCALVDLDAFDANVERLLAPARAAKKSVRIATKSIRVPELIDRVAKMPGVRGLMTYSAARARFSSSAGRAT